MWSAAEHHRLTVDAHLNSQVAVVVFDDRSDNGEVVCRLVNDLELVHIQSGDDLGQKHSVVLVRLDIKDHDSVVVLYN